MMDTIFDFAFPIAMGIWMLSLIIIVSKLALKKKPLIYSNKVGFIFFMIPAIIISLESFHSKEFEFASDNIIPILSLVMIFVLACIIIPKQMYDFIGVTEKSLQESLFAVLKEQNFEWKEDMGLIRIPSENLDIKLKSRGGGTVRIQNKTKQGKEAFERIIGSIKNQLQVDRSAVNNSVNTFLITTGILILVIGGAISAMFLIFSNSPVN